MEEFINQIVLLAMPSMKIDSTKINLKIMEYDHDNHVTFQDLGFKASADDYEIIDGKIQRNRNIKLDELEKSRQDNEIPMVIFTLDLRCITRSKVYGIAYR